MSIPIVIMPKEVQPNTSKHLYVDYCALNSLLLPVVKAHFKAQVRHSNFDELVPLTGITS